jgi:hypothetical protein
MERFGFIHEKLDIKIWILFILRRLPLAVSAETLAELTLLDGGIGYFDYAECLSELVETGHAEETENGYLIAEKGKRNGSTLEDSLPFSARAKAERAIAPIASAMRRSASIKTSHEQRKDGFWVELKMSDGLGDIIDLRLLCAGEDQAALMERNFRAGAESIYNQLMEVLLQENIPEKKKKEKRE